MRPCAFLCVAERTPSPAKISWYLTVRVFIFFVVCVFLLRVRGAVFFLLRGARRDFFCCGCAARFFSAGARRVFLGCACVWRGLLSAVFCCGHARGVVFFADFCCGCGARLFLLWVRGAFFLPAGARCAFLCAAGTRRVFFLLWVYDGAFFCFGCAVRFSLYNAGARRVFLLQVSAGVWRGLFSSAGASWGSRGVRFFVWARGAGWAWEARVCFCCGCAARLFVFCCGCGGGGGGALRQGVRSCFFPCGSETGVRRRVFSLAGANKDTVAMGFVRGAAMVDFHIQGRVEKKWFGLGLAVSVPDNEPVKNSGLAQLGSDRVGLAIKKNWLGLAWLGFRGGGGLGGPCNYPAAMYNSCGILFVSVERWHCVYMGAYGSVCGYKHDWAPAASNKDTVAMGFVHGGTAMVDCHIYGRVEKKWFGLGLAMLVPDNESVKISGLAQLGSDRVGLATERVGNSGDSAGGLGR